MSSYKLIVFYWNNHFSRQKYYSKLVIANPTRYSFFKNINNPRIPETWTTRNMKRLWKSAVVRTHCSRGSMEPFTLTLVRQFLNLEPVCRSQSLRASFSVPQKPHLHTTLKQRKFKRNYTQRCKSNRGIYLNFPFKCS